MIPIFKNSINVVAEEIYVLNIEQSNSKWEPIFFFYKSNLEKEKEATIVFRRKRSCHTHLRAYPFIS